MATSGAIGYDLEMTEGTVRITLDPVRAPCTVHSFVSLADQGFFDETRCHRLVDSGIFLFQCGDPTGTGRGGPGYTFADELDGTESYTKGVIAMANDGSQFFLVYRDSTALDKTPDYTIFGEIDPSGIGILERMAAEGQDGTNPDGGGRPEQPVRDRQGDSRGRLTLRRVAPSRVRTWAAAGGSSAWWWRTSPR